MSTQSTCDYLHKTEPVKISIRTGVVLRPHPIGMATAVVVSKGDSHSPLRIWLLVINAPEDSHPCAYVQHSLCLEGY